VNQRTTTSRGGPVIGISGCIASGKSTVAAMLVEVADGVLISADDIAHALLARDADVRRAILDRWGDSCLDENGGVSRAALAEIVFNSPANLAELNRIIHPRILEKICGKVEATRKKTSKWIVVDAALLFETGLDAICDVTIFVDSDRDVRVQRARENRGWSAEELARRDAAQMPPENKINRSDYTLGNNGSLYEIKRQIERIVQLIKRHRREHNG